MGLFDDAGRALRRLREEKGLLQKEVSERSGVTKGMLSRIENDKADTTLGTLGRILEGMDAGIEDFSRVLKTVQRGEESKPPEELARPSRTADSHAARPKVYVMVEMPARPAAEPDEAARRERADVLGEIERAIETFYPAPRVEESPPAVESPPPIQKRADGNGEGER
jgi:transcriptional regulator with XRE-family HTH domain